MKFIAMGDLHLRDTAPENRIDDYLEEQGRKIKWLNELQKKHDAIILSPGDIFDVYNPSYELLNWTIDNLSNIISIPGNHDLPRHSLKLIDKSGIGVLKRISRFGVNSTTIIKMGNVEIHTIPFGEKIYNPEKNSNIKILLSHVMVTKSEVFWSNGYIAKDMLIKFPEYDYMIIGDNHSSFIEEYNGRYLINCGSFMRMTIAQKEHKPVVYIIDTEDRNIIPEYIPIEDNVFGEIKNKGEDNLDILVEGISDDIELSLSFSNSLEKNIKNESDNIKNLIMECLEDVK